MENRRFEKIFHNTFIPSIAFLEDNFHIHDEENHREQAGNKKKLFEYPPLLVIPQFFFTRGKNSPIKKYVGFFRQKMSQLLLGLKMIVKLLKTININLVPFIAWNNNGKEIFYNNNGIHTIHNKKLKNTFDYQCDFEIPNITEKDYGIYYFFNYQIRI
uniref:Uncharacterized protein n=1 Tax=Strongyloides venezuelensis TaxID=75913 RepID=A0A0K0F2J5_STRVS